MAARRAHSSDNPRDPQAGALWLGGITLLIGAWASLPPYVGPPLNTAFAAEIADHQIPSLVVLACAVIVLLAPGLPRMAMLACGAAVFLAGVWMTATHVPLVMQALGGQAPWPGTVFHSTPAVAVLVLGGVWSWRYSGGSTTEPDRSGEGRRG